MQINERKISAVNVLNLVGELSATRHPEILSTHVSALLASGERLFIINLKECLRLDSMGLGELVKVYALIEAKQGLLKLAEVPLRLRGLVVATNLAEVLEIYDTEREAINSFGN